MNETTSTDETVTMDKLVSDFKVVLHDAEALIKATAGDLGDRAKEARTRLTHSLENARTSFQRVEDRAIEGAKATDKVIRDYPYQSLGVAFGVGVLIGVLVGR